MRKTLEILAPRYLRKLIWVLTVERICTITAVTSHKRPCDRKWI